MHVGVFPKKGGQGGQGGRLPHARGGVSIAEDTLYYYAPSSPCTWGCFYWGD